MTETTNSNEMPIHIPKFDFHLAKSVLKNYQRFEKSVRKSSELIGGNISFSEKFDALEIQALLTEAGKLTEFVSNEVKKNVTSGKLDEGLDIYITMLQTAGKYFKEKRYLRCKEPGYLDFYGAAIRAVDSIGHMTKTGENRLKLKNLVARISGIKSVNADKHAAYEYNTAYRICHIARNLIYRQTREQIGILKPSIAFVKQSTKYDPGLSGERYGTGKVIDVDWLINQVWKK